MITGGPKQSRRGRGPRLLRNRCQWRKPARPHYGKSETRAALSGIMRSSPPLRLPALGRKLLLTRGAILFCVAVVSGAITFTTVALSDKEHALIRTATVLVIACPHAARTGDSARKRNLTSLGAQNGLLVKDRLDLNVPEFGYRHFR